MISSDLPVEPRTAILGETPLATLWGPAAGSIEAIEAGRELVLSRFAWLTRRGEQLVAESPLSSGAVVLHDQRAATLLTALVAPGPIDEQAASASELPLAAALEVVSLLHAAKVVIDADTASAEDEPPLAVWEFQDLLFHSRSRVGRHLAHAGGTYRFRGRFPIEPAVPAARSQEIALARPDWDRIERTDPPLAAVQSARTSVRQYGERPLSVGQLGEFLSRVGRVEDYWEMSSGEHDSSFVAKPYPSGGSLYELEMYAAVQACEGLEPGLYHYAADRHSLERVAEAGPDLNALIASGAAGMGIAPQPMQVLIVLSARMGRIAWKYQSIAYALVLKHVGVVIQTMYLSAAAMGLAPCAIGTGDSDLFARLSGLDYYTEPAVGEFALGSRP